MQSVRETCPICFKQHIRAARKYYYEIHKDPSYFDYGADPHIDGFMEELEHAEQQCPYEQLFHKVRVIKKAFEDVDTIEEWNAVCTDNWWYTLTDILNETRELLAAEKLSQPAFETTATKWEPEATKWETEHAANT